MKIEPTEKEQLFKQKIGELTKKYFQDSKVLFGELLKEIFTARPEINIIVVNCGTPSWADGSACNFGISYIYFRINGDDENEEDLYGFSNIFEHFNDYLEILKDEESSEEYDDLIFCRKDYL